jgi:hypothetical protein
MVKSGTGRLQEDGKELARNRNILRRKRKFISSTLHTTWK